MIIISPHQIKVNLTGTKKKHQKAYISYNGLLWKLQVRKHDGVSIFKPSIPSNMKAYRGAFIGKYNMGRQKIKAAL